MFACQLGFVTLIFVLANIPLVCSSTVELFCSCPDSRTRMTHVLSLDALGVFINYWFTRLSCFATSCDFRTSDHVLVSASVGSPLPAFRMLGNPFL